MIKNKKKKFKKKLKLKKKEKMLNGYNQLVMHFIRPPRSDYDIS